MTTYKNFMSLRESINIYFSFLKLGLEFLQFVAGGSVVKNLPAIQETRVGEGNGTHSSTLAWKLPWMEEPGRLQSMGLLRVGHNRATSLSLFTFMHWRRKWQPTPVFLPGESQGRRSLVGCRLWGRTESDTLKRLSSSSSSRVGWSLDWEDPLEEGMATHSSILA